MLDDTKNQCPLLFMGRPLLIENQLHSFLQRVLVVDVDESESAHNNAMVWKKNKSKKYLRRKPLEAIDWHMRRHHSQWEY